MIGGKSMAHDAMSVAENHASEGNRQSQPHALTLKQMLVVTSNTSDPEATVTVIVNARHETRQCRGKGPVEALFKAIDHAVGNYANGVELTSYSVRSRGKGAAARGYVKICVARNGQVRHGSYEHVDVLLASAQAYIHALRKLDI
ncbi:hypothetical protein C4585_02385 [Candidatus Parcubacteria bacterium]|nr:MAG: hypothetical protein C4585_02385 [Candidatus Parcubacteria bacterium]